MILPQHVRAKLSAQRKKKKKKKKTTKIDAKQSQTTTGENGETLANVPPPRINNVVATFKCGKELNLLRYSQHYGFEFQPSRFAATSLRLRSHGPSRSTALAFTSGK